MEEIMNKIKSTIAKTLSVEADKVTEDAALMDDLGADSLDMAELGMALQEEFGIELSDEQIAGIRTVRDVAAAIGGASRSA